MRWRLGHRRSGHDPRFVVADLHSDSLAAEAFRTLRTNLQFALPGQPLRTVVVTGVGPDEGKTTVAGNLAATLAQGGTRTLLVSADLRRPAVHRMFGLDNDRGLTQVLLGRLTVEDALQRVERFGLDVLASGPIPPNPAELLGSPSMHRFLEEVAQRWETVVLDTPPVVGLADAALVAARADGTLLVVTVGITARDAAVAARRQLIQVGARLLGVVLNGVPPDGSSYYYYYYYYGPDGARRRRRHNQ